MERYGGASEFFRSGRCDDKPVVAPLEREDADQLADGAMNERPADAGQFLRWELQAVGFHSFTTFQPKR